MLNEDTPAQKSMKHCFTESNASRFKRRPRINLPWKLNEDLEKFSNGMKLKTAEDLRTLKALAKDRKITAKAEKNKVFNVI